MVRDHIAGGSISTFLTVGPYQRYVYQITSDITAPGLDRPSGRSHLSHRKIHTVPSAAVVAGKKTTNKPPSEEVAMIQAWNLEY